MSCNSCKTVTTNELPSIAQDYAVTYGVTATVTCSSEAYASVSSDGYVVPTWMTDAGCYNTDVVLLGRVGNRLARFEGSGFLQIIAGKASLVSSVPLRLRNLWHAWWRPENTVTPILGEPKPFPYLAVGDPNGNLHGIKGVSTGLSSPVFDGTEFKMLSLAAQPKSIQGQLNQEDAIELIGFKPLAESDELTDIREQKSFSGAGLIVVERQATVPGNVCNSEEVSVAHLLPVPEGEGPYTLKWNSIDGYYWNEDA